MRERLWPASKFVILIALVLLFPSVGHADAIVPGLVLIWPITILLLIPIIVVEALYSRRPLGMGSWESVRQIGMANVLSSIAGLPIASLLSAALQYGLESVYFRDLEQLRQRAARSGLDMFQLRRHDYFHLVVLGLYPRWILLLSAWAMLIVCFFVSWWAETKWIQRYIRRRGNDPAIQDCNIWRTVRNANLLSYAFVILIVLWLFIRLWPGS